MWIFLSDAFLAVVADRNEPAGDRLLVRARREGDIERVFPEAQSVCIKGADYAFRAWVPRNRVAETLRQQVEAITYSNFKDSILDDEYQDVSHSVWETMHRYQRCQAN